MYKKGGETACNSGTGKINFNEEFETPKSSVHATIKSLEESAGLLGPGEAGTSSNACGIQSNIACDSAEA